MITSRDWEDSFGPSGFWLLGHGTEFCIWPVDGDHLPQAAHGLLGQMIPLSNPPTNANLFLVADVYGHGIQKTRGQTWIQSIYDGLAQFRAQIPSLNFAFVKFATI